jgi:hypothetical protein
LRLPLLASFDQPDMYLSVGQRANTLTPTQSLSLLNGDEAIAAARRWSGRLLADSHGNHELLIRRAWLEVYSRPPSDDEITLARSFLDDQADRVYDLERSVPGASLPEPCPSCLEPHYAAAYVDLCHALLNSSEFVFVD